MTYLARKRHTQPYQGQNFGQHVGIEPRSSMSYRSVSCGDCQVRWPCVKCHLSGPSVCESTSVLTFHAAALSNNPSTTKRHIKQNAQPHGNTTKISHSNHLTNHPSQNNQFSTKSDYITQPHPSILPNKSRNWSNRTYAPSDKLVGSLLLTDGKNDFLTVLILVHSLLSFAHK